jgi:hypothetical protein
LKSSDYYLLTLSCPGALLVPLEYWSDREASSDVSRSTRTAFHNGIKLDDPTGIDRVTGIQSRPIELA